MNTEKNLLEPSIQSRKLEGTQKQHEKLIQNVMKEIGKSYQDIEQLYDHSITIQSDQIVDPESASLIKHNSLEM